MIEVRHEHQGAVARLLLNQPKGNILSRDMMRSLSACVQEEAGHERLRLLVLEGAGDHFSFGASVEEHRAGEVKVMLQTFAALFHTLAGTHLPVASLIRGQCLGGGFELALFSHFLFAGSRSKLGLPEITLGVFPPPAAILLPLKCGNAIAERLVLSGRIFPARELERLGLLDAVWPEEEMENRFQEWVQKEILPLSASSLRFAVRAARLHFHEVFFAALDRLNRLYGEELMSTADANEGIAAFLEKRKPRWRDA